MAAAIEIGAKAPELTLPGANGSSVPLAPAGKHTFLTFYKST